MSDELVEAVARAIAWAGLRGEGCVGRAKAAIAIIRPHALEEAAKVVEDKTAYWIPEAGYELAAAIRALKD